MYHVTIDGGINKEKKHIYFFKIFFLKFSLSYNKHINNV